ncbi:MAG: CotH kinase family protein [Bacteroidales bacterium]|nr:CotH kinase family protein [Bacteroidales bacterium]
MKSIFPYLLLVLSILLVVSCNQDDRQQQPFNISAVQGISSVKSDAEVISEDGIYLLSNDSVHRLDLAGRRSDSIAHSGKYSLKVTKEQPYGFTIDVDQIKRGEIIQADFWCYGFTPLLVFSDSGNIYYQVSKNVIETDSTGWKKIGMKVRAPGNLHNGRLRLFVWNASETGGYVDDFSFERTPPLKRDISPDMLLRIQVDSLSWIRLKKKREEALAKGVLETDDGDYVKAVFIYLDDTLKGSIRLKGDWLDHLRGDKWSFRIKLKSDYSWKGMKTFSVQTPESRSFIDEWLSHQLFKKEDVLTTRYGFVNIELNGQDMGIYAYEEHFDKYLIEYNDRREGPIVKFTEEPFWYYNRLNLHSDRFINIPTFEASNIIPFKINRTSEILSLLMQFENAQNLMLMHKEWGYPLEDIFDVDKLARYMALIDVTKGYHGLAWHNQRFYFNPITCTLEPIAFDCYDSDGVNDSTWRAFIGNFYSPKEVVSIQSNLMHQYFLDKKFRKLYYQYLKKYSDETYIRQFLKDAEQEIAKNEALLREEFFYYEYKDSFLLNNAYKIRVVLNKKMDALIKDDPTHGLKTDFKLGTYDVIPSPEAPPYYIRAYCQGKQDSLRFAVKVVNNHTVDVNVIGYVDMDDRRHFLPQQYTVRSIKTEVNKRDIDVPANSKALIYTCSPFAEIYTMDIYKWKYPVAYSPRADIIKKSRSSGFIAKYNSGRKIIIPEGYHEFTEPIVIPEGYECDIRAGADLNFINQSFFLSYSPVIAMGTSDNKITIRSVDGTSMGFIVLQAKEKSVLRYVTFDQLGALDYKGWNYTGAVTFYETNIELQHVNFINNLSEDGLNIIRSEFSMKNCFFNNIFSDAFDSDFSNGIVELSNFENIKNDAVDFSGSNITIRNCSVKNAKDKGISGGEHSNLIVENVYVANVNVGIASKDNSLVDIKNSSVTASKYGLVAFNKKSEFRGSAVIKTNQVVLKDLSVFALIEKGSVWIDEGDSKKGKAKNVADLFY